MVVHTNIKQNIPPKKMKRRHLSEMRFMLTELMARAGSAGLSGLHCTRRDYVICNNPQAHVMEHYTEICSKPKIG